MKDKGIKALEIMETPKYYLMEHQTWNDALKMFYKSNLQALPIINNQKELLGVINNHQLIEKIIHKRSLFESFIGELDEEQCVVVDKNSIIFNNGEQRYDLICVCENKKLIGVISPNAALQVLSWKVALLRKFEDICKEYEKVFNYCYDSIYEVDSQGNVIRANPATERISGVVPDQVIGKSIYEIESDRTFFPSITPLVLENRKPTTILQNVGSAGKAVVTGVPVFDQKGEIVRIISVTRDISELIELIEESSTDIKLMSKLYERLRKCSDLNEQYSKALSKIQKETIEVKRINTKNRLMGNVVEIAKKIACVDSTVLILGETGVGKDMIATMIHNTSERRGKSFVKINCGAIPEGIFESELFGYEKGAFTGAQKEGKLGLIEIANEGTLFLDEIGELPLNLQVKILQVIQEHSFIKVGGTTRKKVDIRLIAATNKDLKQMVKDGSFREDLFYRLNVVPIVIPPLRERKEDIPELIMNFIEHFNKKYKRNKQLASETMHILLDYDWPGNVRELENLAERLVIVSKDKIIYPEDLPPNIYEISEQIVQSRISHKEGMTLKETIEKVEFEMIRGAYQKYGSTTKAAEALGVNQSTVVRKLKKYRSTKIL